jgi:carbonic anhydrase
LASASIECAVSVLQVPDVIICGHTDCGAVRAMLHHTRTEGIPAASRWLMYGQAAFEQLMKRQPNESDEEEKIALLTQYRVRAQIGHLMTHPRIQRRLEKGDLGVNGWVYEISNGRILVLDQATGSFSRLAGLNGLQC